MTEQERKADQARQILENPVFCDAIEEIRLGIISDIEDMGIWHRFNERRRKKLCLKLAMLRQLEAQLAHQINLAELERSDREGIRIS